MRLRLDAHVSGRNVGGPLRDRGHDVRAVAEDAANEGLDDEEVLELATSEERILVTHNVADFLEILREWAAVGRSHAGIILVYGIDHREFATVMRGIERWLERQPQQEAWADFPAVVDRAFAES